MKGIHPFFIIFLESLTINYNALELATYLEEALGNKKVSSPGQWHSKHKINVSPLGSLLKDK
jgi:hypothetical protein